VADNYVITGQRPDMQISDTGVGFQDVWHVSYRVTSGPSKGTSGTITVPESDHNAKYINQTIADKIKTLDEVASL
jgi:hypothetical protein